MNGFATAPEAHAATVQSRLMLLPTPSATLAGVIANDAARGNTPIILVSIVLVVICVLIHFQAMQFLVMLLRRLPARSPLSIIIVIVSLLLVHLVEIGVFAVGYLLLDHRWEGANLVGDVSAGYIDYAYFSAAVYTTLGFGDLVPEGALRLLTAFEALTGLVLVAWSASFTFLVMQQHWKTQPT